MGSGGSLASQVEQASASDLQTLVDGFGPQERENLKAALKIVSDIKRGPRRRVRCGGKTFAPFGMRSDLPPEPAAPRDFQPYKTDDLPAKVDLRPHMSPIENQSQSNSCCANAVAGAFEYINRKHVEATGDTPGDISRLFIYYVGRKVDMEAENRMFGAKRSSKQKPKDEGMTLTSALTAMQTTGACLAPSWPYDLAMVNEKPTEECFKEAKNYRVLEVQKVKVDIDHMRACLAEGNPIVFGLLLTERFFHPARGGYISTPARDDPRASSHGCHAMLAVGYNDRQQVFIVRNSWGESWGDNGYCLVPYDYLASQNFNIGQQYAIVNLSKVDFTPGPDDGNDFEIQDQEEDPVVVESDEEPEEPDEEDDFDWEENFKGDQVVKQFFIEHGGELSRSGFQLLLSLFNRGEGGKTFDEMAAWEWVEDDSKHPGRIYWLPEHFVEVVNMFQKQSDAEKYPNLAFLFQ